VTLPPGEAKAGNGEQLSSGGGFAPSWRAAGQELFHFKIDGSVMSVEQPTGPVSGATARLFVVSGVIPEWGVTNGARRFLFAVPSIRHRRYVVRNAAADRQLKMSGWRKPGRRLSM